MVYKDSRLVNWKKPQRRNVAPRRDISAAYLIDQNHMDIGVTFIKVLIHHKRNATMKYIKKATQTTPEVIINLNTGFFKLTGRSSPENSQSFYAPLMRVLRSEKINLSSINMDFCFEYFNTSSSKCLFDIFRQLKRMQGTGTEINVNWFYEPHDEDMLEAGEDYDDIVDLNFNFVEHHKSSDYKS